jgi:hypothetical protein
MFGGDMWHLALAYFQIGLADEGWELLRGAMLESAYGGAVPGGFSQIGAGTDFSDCKDMFARAVVEGLFGFDPDYPNGVVRMRPELPSAWPKASIRTPDYTFDYQGGDRCRYRLSLARAAEIDFRLPVRAESVRRVTLNGRSVGWQAEAGPGCTWIRLRTPKTLAADVAMETAGRLPPITAVTVDRKVGDAIRLAPPRGRILHWQDLHGVIDGGRSDGTAIIGRLARKPGYHLLLAETEVGQLPQRHLFKLHVTDPQGDAARAAYTPRVAPQAASWQYLDLARHFNGDVRTIFQQRYSSPRPTTCSVRLGIDGYSAWTFAYWGDRPPAIDLSNAPQLTDGRGHIRTPQNVPFAWPGGSKNIAFTSLWDNWLPSVCVPVSQRAEAVWLLLCGSTNPMQSRIANAEVRLQYRDGKAEKLELVPSLNFWSLCS